MKVNSQEDARQTNSAKADGMVRPAGSVAWVASGIGPRIMFAPPDAPGLAGGADPSPTPAATPAATPTTPTDPAPAGGSDPAPAAPAKAERPDWLPESLWDAEKGFKQQDFDDLVAFKAERTSADASKPESADAYEAKLPESFKLPENIKLEEGQQIIDPADPRIVELRKIAHEKGWSQADFEDVIALGVNMDIAKQAREAQALNAEKEKLGSRAKERIDSVVSWVKAKLGPEMGGSLLHMMYTAKQVEAFERIMSLNRGDVPGTPGANREGGDGKGRIEGYENMTFRQKMLAIDALKASN
jgi:hypothetical protein